MELSNFLMFIAIANSIVLLALFAVVLKELKIVKSGLLYVSSMVHRIKHLIETRNPEVASANSEKAEVDRMVDEIMQMLKEFNGTKSELD